MFLVYEWNAWWQFKMVRAMPEAVRVTARPGERAEDVLARCPAGAVAFAFHLNATFSARIPHAREDLVSGLVDRGVVPINASVTNISKRWLHSQCAACGLPVAAAPRHGDADERLIIKTNHNFGATSERLLPPGLLAELEIAPPSTHVADATGYRVLRRCEVPDAWWADPTLAVERYIENRSNRIYRVSFAGRRFDVLSLINTNVIKKVDQASERATYMCDRDRLARGAVPGVEPAVGVTAVRFVDYAGIDFGSLDVMLDHDGQAYVLDVNSTPYGGSNSLRRLLNTRRGLLEMVTERSPQPARVLRQLGGNVWPHATLLVGEAKRLAMPSRQPPE